MVSAALKPRIARTIPKLHVGDFRTEIIKRTKNFSLICNDKRISTKTATAI